MQRQIIWEGDTDYGHYQVVDAYYDARPARVLYSGERQAAQSGIAKDDKPELLFDYIQRLFELITSLQPKRLLLIGGGVYTLPVALLVVMPELQIDVVELDSGLTNVAQQFFGLEQDERLRIFHTDGRTYLRKSTDKYDFIVIDAFTHTTIPRDLKTVEMMQALHAHMPRSGVVAMNIISAYDGRSSHILRELYAGYCQVFDTVDIFLAGLGYSLWLPQNFILTAQKGQDRSLKDYMRYIAVQPPDVDPREALRDQT